MQNDQTIKRDAGKLRLTLVPSAVIRAIASVRMFAVDHKYHDPDSWKRVEIGRYRDALYRHLLMYLDDPDGVDEESGLPHLWHIATNVAFLCELEEGKPIISAEDEAVIDMIKEQMSVST